ncbi:hypothetical protein D554_1912 [Bordetella holmesii 30539]|uniref:N-acetyltransferase YedL n=1 Tax=Bordetella holmesii 1058 TaxID=1247648 RepID=A0ABP3BHV3_9BORD|nr:hypothetical protein D560_0257 [Bordetella holmesii ATCC 51541]AIT24945.1 hypothetical protein D558_0252 [Bordetella holmesii 44057]AMD44207.1 hypothetical protein H558_01110 [Bordetella holmesii H558]AOB36316.1 hypothetical protein BBB42_12925 [Bordetella holmesii]EWM45508.1 hypothetical protein D557_3512 [Bordetella holmesii 70147]EWM48723.1 hypothetical protein D556_0256 [Bordetella holmesii 41130]EWM49634.1 hypothetical protein D555_0258 [Bordetella holmesii 35009]EXF89090.1 hypotheti
MQAQNSLIIGSTQWHQRVSVQVDQGHPRAGSEALAGNTPTEVSGRTGNDDDLFCKIRAHNAMPPKEAPPQT